MDLEIENQRFIVCGASSGFGRAIAERLLDEEASVVAIARRESKLQELKNKFGAQVHIITGDLTLSSTREKIIAQAKKGPAPWACD